MLDSYTHLLSKVNVFMSLEKVPNGILNNNKPIIYISETSS